MNRSKQLKMLICLIIGLTLMVSFPIPLVYAGSYSGNDLATAVIENSSTFIASSYTDTDANGHRQAKVITSPMGTMQATHGPTFIMLSTGIAGTPIITTNAYDPGSERGEYFHGKYDAPRDRSTLELTLEVPPFMHYLYYDVQFFTAEYPDYIDSQYNDVFTATVNSPGMGTSQYLMDVNGGDFVLDSNDIAGTGFDIFATDGNPYGPDGGVDMVSTTPNSAPDGGATALVTREHAVSPGEQITVTFDIVDTGDNQFDSGAFIDNLCFSGFAKTEVMGRKTAVDLNGDVLECGDTIKYTITISNTGAAAQTDNPGNEFEDVIPANATFVDESLSSTSGTAQYLSGEQKIIWNGAIPGESSVKIEFEVTVNDLLFSGSVVSNQGTIFWDSDESGDNDATELTDDPSVDDEIDQDGDGDTDDDDPTILIVTSMEVPTEVTEDFSNDVAGGKASESYEGYQWFETTTCDSDTVFEVASSYRYSTLKSFKSKLRDRSAAQYWNYNFAQLSSGVNWWEIWFICGNASEPYLFTMEFQDSIGENLVQLQMEYTLVEDDGITDYLPLISFKNQCDEWTPLLSDYDGGYLQNDWYKLRIAMDDDVQYESFELYRNGVGLVDSHLDKGCSTQPLSDLVRIKWSTEDNPVVCPLLFWDEHHIGLTPMI